VAVTAGIVIGAMMLGLIAGIPMAVGQVYGIHINFSPFMSACLVMGMVSRAGSFSRVMKFIFS